MVFFPKSHVFSVQTIPICCRYKNLRSWTLPGKCFCFPAYHCHRYHAVFVSFFWKASSPSCCSPVACLPAPCCLHPPPPLPPCPRKKDDVIEKLQAEIHAKNTEIDAKNTEVDAKNTEIDGKNTEIDAKNAEIYSKNSEISTKDSEISTKISEIVKLKADNNVTKADNTKLTEEIERLKKQIQLGSSSSVVAGLADALAPLLKVGGTSPTLKRNDDNEVCLTNVSATLFARLFLPSSVL